MTTDPIADRKNKESDVAFKRLNYAIQLLQNEVGRVWQRSLVFWGFVAASFVAYGAFIEKDRMVALVIACFGLVCCVCWTLVNRASRWSQNLWVRRVDSLEFGALKVKILMDIPKDEHKKALDRLWDGARYSTTQLMIALSDATAIVWIFLVCKSSITVLKRPPSEWNGAVVAVLLITVLYIVAIIVRTRPQSDESATTGSAQTSGLSDRMGTPPDGRGVTNVR
jgi:hypothetical protein